MSTYWVKGTYGGGSFGGTECVVLCHETDEGTWYAVKGSANVSLTNRSLGRGVNVETLEDYDTFTASKPIMTCAQLVRQIES